MSEISFAELSNNRTVYYWAYGGGALLLLVSLALWWTKVSVQPQRVFWGMINQSLATSGTTMQIKQTSGTTTVNQLIQYSVGTTNKAHAATTLKDADTSIVTELVGDRSTTYTRYSSVNSGKNASSKNNMAPKLKSVIGVWAKADITAGSTNQPTTLLSQAALGVGLPLGAIPVPIGSVTSDQRAKLVEQMRQQSVYQTDFSKVATSHQNGRLMYTYTVSMQPILYLDILKSFAKDVGLHDLDQVDPNDYSGQSAIAVSLTVDAHAKQLVKVASSGSSYEEDYSGYGILANPSLPKNAISSDELQKRLANIGS